MFRKLINAVFMPVEDEYKQEFLVEIYRINIVKIKVVCAVAVFVELILLSVTVIKAEYDVFGGQQGYYCSMYIVLILFMTASFLVFSKLEKSIACKIRSLKVAFIIFIVFIILWNIGITLLDQQLNGEIISYIMAVVCTAILAIGEPLIILAVYIATFIVFAALLPHFQTSPEIVYSNIVNSLIAIFFSWAIQLIFTANQLGDFNNRKKIRLQNDQLCILHESLKAANIELERLACTDGLTGIYNRAMFDKLLSEAWETAKETVQPLTLILVDVDSFKEYNDNYGHVSGDNCLKLIAKTLSEACAKHSGAAARYGGDEFALLFENKCSKEAYYIADRLNDCVKSLCIEHEFSEYSDIATISLGVYTAVPSASTSKEDLIRSADTALYKAKKHGAGLLVKSDK